MAQGDANDMAARMRQVMPAGWFPTPPGAGEAETAPVLQGLLVGMGSVFAYVWQLLGFVRLQTRVGTATGPFLDMISQDFFGLGLPRQNGESDAGFRVRIKTALFPQETTRAALTATIQALTGSTPSFLVLRNAGDTKGYGAAGAAGSLAGGGYGYGAPGLHYGDLNQGSQLFIQVPSLGGASLSALYAAINQTLAAGVVAWVRIGS